MSVSIVERNLTEVEKKQIQLFEEFLIKRNYLECNSHSSNFNTIPNSLKS